MTSVYAEYKTNLYVKGAYGCVVSEDGSNIFEDHIPVAEAYKRLQQEDIHLAQDAAILPDGSVVSNDETVRLVRKRDSKIQGSRASGGQYRPYTYLIDQATGVTGEGRDDLKITAVGTTRDGGRAYLQIRTDDKRDVEGLSYDPFVNFGMSYDGTLGIISIAGTNVYSCANMVSASYGRKTARKAKTRQTKRVTDEMIIDRHTVALQLEQAADEFETEVKRLVQTTVSDKQWGSFLDELFPVVGKNDEELSKRSLTLHENARGELNTLYTQDDRAKDWNGTALGVLQAANTYDLWVRGSRNEINPAVRMFDESLNSKGVNSRAEREGNIFKTLTKVLETV